MKIPTRLHGAIDYAMASLLGSLAVSGALPRPLRRVVGTASAVQGSYAALTDYEAGLRPVLGMRAHLLLDAAGGAALCGAGLLMRRQPAGSRALLLAVGVSELLVTAFSSADPVSGPGQGSGPVGRVLDLHPPSAEQVGYPPVDTPKPVADDVFVVDSLMTGPLGSALPVRMTVIRLPGGDLVLHSPTRFSYPLKIQLETLGRIRHLVAPNVAHWVFLSDWQRACPDAVTWAAPGLRERGAVRRSGVRLDNDLGDVPPPEWEGITLVTVPGGLGFLEVALFHGPSRTLVLTDLVLNLEAQKLPAALRPLARLLGVVAPDGMPATYLRAVIKLRRASAVRAAQRLVDLRPERVVFAHGTWFERDGTAALRHSLRWLLD